jgi:hypothetical protein
MPVAPESLPPPQPPAQATPPAPTEPTVIADDGPCAPALPASWSTITLAFDPAGRRCVVVDKDIPESATDPDAFDPEVRIKAWESCWLQDLRRQVETNADRADGDNVLMVYSMLLLRAGEVLARNAFHVRISNAFTTGGCYSACDRLERALLENIIIPARESLNKEIGRVLPEARQRSPRAQDTAEAPTNPAPASPGANDHATTK